MVISLSNTYLASFLTLMIYAMFSSFLKTKDKFALLYSRSVVKMTINDNNDNNKVVVKFEK